MPARSSGGRLTYSGRCLNMVSEITRFYGKITINVGGRYICLLQVAWFHFKTGSCGVGNVSLPIASRPAQSAATEGIFLTSFYL
jgi:hypothetical protein